MTSQAPGIPPAQTHPSIARGLLWYLIPLILALAATMACYIAGGVSLGLFFGPILLATFLTPPLAMSTETACGRLLVCAALSLGVLVVWLVTANLALSDACRCTLVLCAYVIALAGAAAMFDSLGMGPTFASALTVFLGIAWLTWALWLLPCLGMPEMAGTLHWTRWVTGPDTQTLVNRLTFAHPLMAINGVVVERFTPWDHFRIAYQRLTRLNQDVLFVMPASVTPMVAIHCGIGGLGLGVAEFLRRRRTNEK